MKNNDNTSQIQISNDLKQIENENNIEFDFTGLQTLMVDGVLVYCDGTNMRLLFFHRINSFASGKGSKKQKQINKCMIEIQMNPAQLNIISGVIQAAIQTYQSKKGDFDNKPDENKKHNTSMFV